MSDMGKITRSVQCAKVVGPARQPSRASPGTCEADSGRESRMIQKLSGTL